MNNQKECFVIGDVHGCLAELKELIKDIDRTTTRILLVGDLIDRGPDSEKVINYVREHNIECVKGNHELMAEECLGNLENFNSYRLYASDWFYNGGSDVLAQYKRNSSVDKLIKDIKWLSKLPLYIKTGIEDSKGLELLVSHTYCLHKDLNNINEMNFVWDRHQPKSINSTSKFYNIYGHTPSDLSTDVEPTWYDGACNLDTGCCYNTKTRGVLTGVYFPSLKVKQIKRITT